MFANCAILRVAVVISNTMLMLPSAALDSFQCGHGAEPVLLYGVRVESSNVIEYDHDGVAVVSSGKTVLRLFGCELHKIERIRVIPRQLHTNHSCDQGDGQLVSQIDYVLSDTLKFAVSLGGVGQVFEFCADLREMPAEHQWLLLSRERHLAVKVGQPTHSYYMPLPIQIVMIVLLLCLSGLFSGLNLGLMALDLTELTIIQKSGTETERRHAERIIPVRNLGNYLLCTLLLGNVIVNSSISILFDDLTSGFIALAVSSLGIVILGEIGPQAICSRYGLAIGAKTIWITRFFMVLTFPMSYPISKLLDCILGKEVGHIYDKNRLLELIRLSAATDVHRDDHSKKDELDAIKIAQGALELGHKIVEDVMTLIHDVYMVSIEAVLDAKTLGEIVQSGFTRIPVCQPNNRSEVEAILNVKDLVLLDPDNKTPVKTVCQFYKHQLRFVFADTPLSVMLDEFRSGHYHMAMVKRVVELDDADPTYELAGLITLEDVIEEIIQAEIIDETDTIMDNRQRIRRKGREVQLKDLSVLIANCSASHDSGSVHVSAHLLVATYQYLSTQIEAFSDLYLNDKVLQRLVQQSVFTDDIHSAEISGGKLLFTAGKPVDYFVLVLEGRLQVATGRDNFLFEAGPFFPLGRQIFEVIIQNIGKIGQFDMHPRFYFEPDFTATISEKVTYLRVKSADYVQALRASSIVRDSAEYVLLTPDVDESTITGNDESAEDDKRRMTPKNSTSMSSGFDELILAANCLSGVHEQPKAHKASAADDQRLADCFQSDDSWTADASNSIEVKAQNGSTTL